MGNGREFASMMELGGGSSFGWCTVQMHSASHAQSVAALDWQQIADHPGRGSVWCWPLIGI